MENMVTYRMLSLCMLWGGGGVLYVLHTWHCTTVPLPYLSQWSIYSVFGDIIDITDYQNVSHAELLQNYTIQVLVC